MGGVVGTLRAVVGTSARVAPTREDDDDDRGGVEFSESSERLAQGTVRGDTSVVPVDESFERDNGVPLNQLPVGDTRSAVGSDGTDTDAEYSLAAEAGAGRQQQEDGNGAAPADQRQAFGIAALEDLREDLLKIEGISEAIVDKIIEAILKRLPLGFASASQHHAQLLDATQVRSDNLSEAHSGEISFFERLDMLVAEAMQEVEDLAELHIKHKHLLQPLNLTKATLREMEHEDLVKIYELYEVSKDLQLCEIGEPSSLRICAKANFDVYLATPVIGNRCSKKRKGFDLILYKGWYVMPSASITGNKFVDRINDILFDLYMIIHDFLEAAHYNCKGAKAGCKTDAFIMADMENKVAATILRSTCKKIRDRLLGMGCMPLNEPDQYWRKIFPQVKF